MASTKDKKNSKANESPSTEVVEPKKPFRFGPGNTFGGRPVGSRNKLSEAVIKDILADWEVAGPSAIQACRLTDPAAYCRIVTSLVPKEFTIKDSESALASIIDQFNDQQLDQFFGLLDAIASGRVETQGQGHKTKALAGS